MRRLLFTLLFASLTVACTHDLESEHATEQETMAMIINSPIDANAGSLLVKLNSYSDSFALESYANLDFEVHPLVPAGRATTEELYNEELYRWWLVKFDTTIDVEEVAKILAKDSRLEAVEYNVNIEPISSEQVVTGAMPQHSATRSHELPFNDAYLADQWHYHNDGSLNYGSDRFFLEGADINLFEAWKHTAGDRRVIVAVMDGGVKYNHADLIDNMWVNEAEANGSAGVDDDGNGYVDDIHGYNFNDGNSEIWFDDHGTHVAGTIAAVNNNGEGVAGVAGGSGNNDGCRIMTCQIFKGGKPANEANIAAALKYAADNGAVIANNSWAFGKGIYTSDSYFNRTYSVLMDAISYFEKNAGIAGTIEGGVLIFAAGNDNYNTPSYPGAYYSHICVTAMSPDYTAASYTNYGPGANICAPGGEMNVYGAGPWYGGVVSTTADGSYYGMAGTSMAAPHVSGCAALAMSYALKLGKSITAEELKSLILSSTHDIDKYQVGTKSVGYPGAERYMNLSEYVGKLGNGYIDAHLLLMQIEGTPCLYVEANNKEQALSLDNYFGDGSSSLTYSSVTMTNKDMESLGMSSQPTINGGKLTIKCSKRGAGRVSVTAIVGGTSIGGGDNMGGMELTREFMIVARPNIASNGGWL